MSCTGDASSRSHHCVVVGAGVVGAAVAQQLAGRGASVTVTDRAPDVGGGCSYANAALVASLHVAPLATPRLLREAPRQMLARPPAVRVRARDGLARWLASLAMSAYAPRARAGGRQLRALAHRSAWLHTTLADAGKNPGLRRTGALDVYLRAPWSTPDRFLTPDAVHRLEPALARVAGATHESDEWTVESRSFIRSMLQDAADHGARVLFGTAVERLCVTAGRTTGVQTSAGPLDADHVVLAAGLGSPALAAQAGLTLPLRGGRGYVIDLALPKRPPAVPIRIKDHRIVVTPLEDRVRVSGALEFGIDADGAGTTRSEELRRTAARAVPALRSAEVIDRWSGERPCTPDGLPVIGASERAKGLSVATGHGMWGLALAPVTAEIITDQIEGRSPGPTSLDPDRFTRPASGARPRPRRRHPHSVPTARPRTPAHTDSRRNP